MTGIELLDSAIKRAEYFAEQLAKYYEDRVILVVEDSDEWGKKDYEYWMQRSEFYKAKGEKLNNKDYNRESRLVTSEKRSIDVYEATELSKIRTRARNAVRGLAMLLVDNSLLEADSNYWLNRNEFCKADCNKKNYNKLRTPEIQFFYCCKKIKTETAKDCARSVVEVYTILFAIKILLKTEKQQKNFTDLEYWRRKETIYRTVYNIFSKKSALEHAKCYIYIEYRKLATFFASRVLLQDKNYKKFATDFKY